MKICFRTCFRGWKRMIYGRHGNIGTFKVLQVVLWLTFPLGPSGFLTRWRGCQLLLIGSMTVPVRNVCDLGDHCSFILRKATEGMLPFRRETNTSGTAKQRHTIRCSPWTWAPTKEGAVASEPWKVYFLGITLCDSTPGFEKLGFSSLNYKKEV